MFVSVRFVEIATVTIAVPREEFLRWRPGFLQQLLCCWSGYDSAEGKEHRFSPNP
jgi:hypothetical protein